MIGLVRFEELKVWQRARRLAGEIYRMTDVGPISRDFGLKNQLRRAAVSVMSNIAEGFECNSLRSFARFLRIAKASLAELHCQLYVAKDVGSVPADRQAQLLTEVEELSRMLGGLIRSLDRRLETTKRK
jgi:four helix bundle protein